MQTAGGRQALRLRSLRPILKQQIDEAGQSLIEISAEFQASLPKLICPILFALSQDNREHPLRRYMSVLDPLLKAAPQHKFTVFRGSFHPLWDDPQRFSLALTGFVQSLLPLSRHTHSWLLAAVDWPTANTNLWKCVHPDCPEERILPSGQNANGL